MTDIFLIGNGWKGEFEWWSGLRSWMPWSQDRTSLPLTVWDFVFGMVKLGMAGLLVKFLPLSFCFVGNGTWPLLGEWTG